MWNDWHNEVRKAAAQTLGKTGHGKDVHDELREKIIDGNERERVEAVSKVGHLGQWKSMLYGGHYWNYSPIFMSMLFKIGERISCSSFHFKEFDVIVH